MDEHSPVKPKGLVLTLSEVAALLRISPGLCLRGGQTRRDTHDQNWPSPAGVKRGF